MDLNSFSYIVGSSPAAPLVLEEKSATFFEGKKAVPGPVVSGVAGCQKTQNLNSFLEGLTAQDVLDSDKQHARIAETYKNQNRARKILYGFEKLILEYEPTAAHLTELERHYTAMNKHSTIKCMRIKNRDTDNVGIRVDQKHRRAIYTGVVRCGSPWVCQPCANKIQSRRADEIKKAFAWAYQKNRTDGRRQKQMVMITQTFPHGINDDLGETMEMVKVAEKIFCSGASFTAFKKEYGYEGMIKALEITYGKINGWHPHFHKLFILDFDIDEKTEKKIRKWLLKRWEDACIKAGLLKHGSIMDFRKCSIDVMFKAKDSDYLSKLNQEKEKKSWGADKEMASASTKQGRMHGKTPFQLLEESDGNTRYKELFLEYALHFKGKRQLVWSRGLKEKVGVVEKSDEQLASEQTEQTDLLALLSDHQWRIVNGRNHRRVDERAHVEWIAVNLGFDGLANYFAEHGSILARPEVVDERVFDYAMSRGGGGAAWGGGGGGGDDDF